MSTDTDLAIDLERFELRLLPNDPPPSADILVEEDRLPYDLAVPMPSPALVRVIEHFGLPVRPLIANRQEGDDDEYQVLGGAAWLRLAREAGMDRIPVRSLELPDLQAAFLALVLNQQWPADVAAQADALQALLEAGVDEQDLGKASGLGRGRIRRLATLLELHPTLRQALREGNLRPQVAFAAAALSPDSQEHLASIYQEEGELTTAMLRRASPDVDGAGVPAPEELGVDVLDAGHPSLRDDDGDAGPPPQDPAARARRQAEELLRTLEQAHVGDEIRQRVAEVVEELGRLAV
jgi:ParB-like chromosome segregation protein Spo0J